MGRGVLDGAFALLEELTRSGEAGLTQIAANAGLPKATAYRLLRQLVAVGAVEQRAGQYRIGPRMFHVGQAWQPAAALRAAAWHPLRQLASAIGGASVNVGVPDAGRTLIVATLRGDADDAIEVRPGLRFPLGVGQDRLWAAYFPNTELPPVYSATEWQRLVRDVRKHDGLVINKECPYVPAVSTVGAPVVHSLTGEVIASVSARVLDNRVLKSIAPVVSRAANMVAANLSRLTAKNPALYSW
ncbi:IclR family transcriptional regulator [Kibdelosporangium aridum]|uniref:IclR family transcriptional regulator n=1 Tax=Kibdelosporangium aridum TaxID=2030 RepID=UPI000B2520CF